MGFNFDWHIMEKFKRKCGAKKRFTQTELREHERVYQHHYYLTVTKQKRKEKNHGKVEDEAEDQTHMQEVQKLTGQ